MAGEKHLYLVAQGSYIHAGLSAERWQTGTRLWADDSVPDNSGTLPNTGDFGEADDTGSGDNWTITSDWIWNVGLAPVIAPVDYLTDQACPAWTDFMGAGHISAKCQLDRLILYPILSTGRVFEARKAVATFTAPVPGTNTANMLPPEVSIAMSLQTPRIGRRGRGRMFLPPTGTSDVGTDGFTADGVTGDIATAGAALMHSLGVEASSPADLHVRPIVTGSPWSQYGVVMSVNVGNVFDAQRRRRRQLVETRVSEDVTYG